MFVDFVLNGQAQGPVGTQLASCRFDPGMLRPYIETNPNSPYRGRPCATIETGRMIFNHKTSEYEPERKKFLIRDLQERGINSPVFNTTTLRKEEWIEMDRVVIRSSRQRMRAWADLLATNVFGGFNAMAKLTLEYEAQNDPGSAVVDMYGLNEGRDDKPLFKLRSLPLPITHSDFSLSLRELSVSRNGGTPLDTNKAEYSGRRIGEMVERTLIGTETGLTYGTQTTGVGTHDGVSKIYGYTNYPNRTVKINMAVPTGSNPEVTMRDVISMRESMYTLGFYGPFRLYHSTDWDAFLDDDYARLGGANANMTLRDRIRAIDGIEDIRRLDFLPASTNPFTMIMVQMTPDVIRAINGMPITTVQWEERGGMQLKFMVMCIQVPQIRSDYNGRCGLVHATTA